MRFRLCAVFAAFSAAFGQPSPNFSGVWKADIAKSKFAGPMVPTSYLVIVDQDASKISELIGNTGPRGEDRTSYTFNLDAKPSDNLYRGHPMRAGQPIFTADTVKIESKVAGEHPGIYTQTLTLSPDRGTLTMDVLSNSGDRSSEQLIVLEKQPDSAGAALRAPEQTAGARFKNVQLLKDLPASQFMETMRYFEFSVGKECEFCHVHGNFAADDKKTKMTARTMIKMVHSVDANFFDGRTEVVCYTCHRGQHEPQSLPSFQ